MSLAETATVTLKSSRRTARPALNRLERAERFWGWVMILPLLLGVTVFYLIPFLQNIFLQLYRSEPVHALEQHQRR